MFLGFLRGERVKCIFRKTYGAALTNDSSSSEEKHASNCKKISEILDIAPPKMAIDA